MYMSKCSKTRRKNQFFSFLFVFVILVWPLSTQARTPNDPEASQWGYDLLQVADAWQYTQGSKDVVVAVIDNGFDTFHPDLYPNVWQNEDEIAGNGIDDDNNGYVDDRYGWDFHDPLRDEPDLQITSFPLGDNDPRPDVLSLYTRGAEINRHFHHGTVVAGIIGAVGNNNQYGTGINWQVKLMNLKITDANSGQGRITALGEAIRYAVDNGADVINFSVVGSDDQNMREAIDYAYEQGVAMVAASGNSMLDLNSNPFYPVCADAGEPSEKILGVSVIREGRFASGFSNVGSDCIDIAAPGVNISSTQRFAPSYGLTEAYGGNWQGTSFGAPFVSGALALLKSIHEGWGPDTLYNIVLSTVSRTPPENPELYAQLFGAGLLDIGAAVQEAQSRKAILGPEVTTIAVQSVDQSFMLDANAKLTPTVPVSADLTSPTLQIDSAQVPSFIDSVLVARQANVQGDDQDETLLVGTSGGQTMLVILSSEGYFSRAVIIGSGEYGLALVDTDADGMANIYTYPKQGGALREWKDGRSVSTWKLPTGAWQFVVTYDDGTHVIY